MRTQLSLSHFSDNTHITPVSIPQDADPVMKPSGLWVSVDGEYDWPAWNEAENFRDTSQQTRFRVTLDPDAPILHLSDYAGLVHFTHQYGKQLNPYSLLPPIQTMFIDWQAVASDHDGIIISPYNWPARHEMIWYYPWDCASGCIWNADAITSITRVTHHDGARSTDPKETLA